MPDYWPQPEEAEAERRRLSRWRYWLLPVAGGLGSALAVFIAWCLWKLAEAI